MFAIDTGATGGGSKGPWISFKPKGSAKHGLPYKSWALRDKTDAGSTITQFTGMVSPGVVLDIYAKGGQLCGSLKLGWSKSDGETGKAPERRWWQSLLRPEPRPDESKTVGGGYTWRNSLSVRVAIGGGKAATWEDEGWGTYKGFSNLVAVINAGLAVNEGLCPLVRCIGYADSGSGANTTFIPQFEVIKWVPRPAALAEDAPQIAAAIDDHIPEPAPAPRPVAAPAPAVSRAVPEDAAF